MTRVQTSQGVRSFVVLELVGVILSKKRKGESTQYFVFERKSMHKIL